MADRVVLEQKLQQANDFIVCQDEQLSVCRRVTNFAGHDEIGLLKAQLDKVERRLKEKEDDYDKIVHDLIDAKMQVANAMNDVDNERKRANDLRRQLRALS